MAAWLPVLKAALPYLGNIVAAALPVFTARREQDTSSELVSRQIAELQEAVTGNAETVKKLAAQVEQSITALAAGEAESTQRLSSLHDALARCEDAAALAQAQVTRLEGVVAAMQARADALERQRAGTHRRERAVAAIALLALLLALFALLR